MHISLDDAGTAKKQKYIPIEAMYNSLLCLFMPSPVVTHHIYLIIVNGQHGRYWRNIFQCSMDQEKENCWWDKKITRNFHVEGLWCNLHRFSWHCCLLPYVHSIWTTRITTTNEWCSAVSSDASTYQALIWWNSHCPVPNLPSLDSMGWECTTAELLPKLMSLSPIPYASLEIISCSCHTQCRNFHCKYRKAGIPRSTMCGCRKLGESSCINNL